MAGEQRHQGITDQGKGHEAQAGKRVKVIERVSLDARRSLFLVEIDGKQMVLGGGDVVRIADVDGVALPKSGDRRGLFDKVLAAAGVYGVLSAIAGPHSVAP